MSIIAGVDLGGTAINYTLVDMNGRFLIEGLFEHTARSVEGPDVCLQQIADACRDYGVALVVMATHRRFGLARFFFGNVANDAIHEAGAPFLLIGPQPTGDNLLEAGELEGLVLG